MTVSAAQPEDTPGYGDLSSWCELNQIAKTSRKQSVQYVNRARPSYCHSAANSKPSLLAVTVLAAPELSVQAAQLSTLYFQASISDE